MKLSTIVVVVFVVFVGFVVWRTGEECLEVAERMVEQMASIREAIVAIPPCSSFVTARATWYAHPTDRWFRRIPALGLRSKTKRTISDYAKYTYCVAVPINDTIYFPLGTRTIILGRRGVAEALVADVNVGTAWDLEARLFEAVCGNLKQGVAIIKIRKVNWRTHYEMD